MRKFPDHIVNISKIKKLDRARVASPERDGKGKVSSIRISKKLD